MMKNIIAFRRNERVFNKIELFLAHYDKLKAKMIMNNDETLKKNILV